MSNATNRPKRPAPPPPPPPRVQVCFPLPILCKCIGHRMVFVGADVLGAAYCTRCGHTEPAKENVWPRMPETKKPRTACELCGK